MKVSADIRALIERRKEGHNLEAPFYTRRGHLRARHGGDFPPALDPGGGRADIPEPGDYVTVELGSDSILIVRDDDMAIRAFHNVCRHRGARQ